MPARVVTLLVPLCLLLLVTERAGGQTRTRVQEYTSPYEVTDKDLSTLYGRYKIYEAIEYRGSITNTADEGQGWVGQELIVTATLYRQPNLRIENPTYTVWYYPFQPEGNVPSRSERWSSFYDLDRGQAVGDEIIEVYKPGGDGPWTYLEIIGSNELWVGFSGWYYKARKTTRPVLSPGHADYCQVRGPCSAGQGDCDSQSECHSGLKCVDDRGAHYGFAATVSVCEATPRLKGAVEGISHLHRGPLTLAAGAQNLFDTYPTKNKYAAPWHEIPGRLAVWV